MPNPTDSLVPEKLTDDLIKHALKQPAADPTEVRYLRDTEVRGFYVRHNPVSNDTAFYVQADQPVIDAEGTRVRKRQVTIRLGTALLPSADPRRITCADARREASRLKGLIMSGEDFLHDGKWYYAVNELRQRQKMTERFAGYTLRQAMKDYLLPKHYPRKSERLKKEFESLMERHFGPLMAKPIGAITPSWIHDNYDTAHQTHKAFTGLSGILRFLDDEKPGVTVDHAVRKQIKVECARYEPKVAELTIKPHHLPIIWEQLDAIQPSEPYSDLYRFVLLTGMRLGEAGELEWKRVDFKDQSFWIPDSKNDQQLHLPMTRLVKELLERRNEKRAHERYVFGSPVFAEGDLGANGSDAREKFVAAVQKAITEQAKKADPDSAADPVLVKANAHQLRKFVRNTLSMDLMLSDTIVDAILNHAPKGVGARHYTNRSDVRPKRRPMQMYEDLLMQWVEGKDADVISLDAARAALAPVR